MALMWMLAALMVVTSQASASVSKDHPIQGVLTLLEKLEVQAHQEGETEAETYQKFQYWCKRSERKLKRALKKEDKAIAALDDQLKGLAAEVDQLTKEVADAEKQIEELTSQEARAKELRANETKLYKENVESIDSTIAATDEAISTMDSFLQLASHHRRIRSLRGDPDTDALMKMDPGKNNPYKPKPKVFSNHEAGVVETFKNLEDGWRGDKISDEEKETNALNAYALAKQARDTAMEAARGVKGEKETLLASASSEKAQAESDRAETAKMRDADSTTLEDTVRDCKSKAGEYEERTKIRSNEIEAMKMAQKILSKVSGVRNPDEHEIPAKKSLMESIERVQEDTAQYAQVTTLLQLGNRHTDPRARVVNLLRKTAEGVHSESLKKFAREISSFTGPYDKIKTMINKMVFRLMAEQKDEDDHKLWCDVEEDKSTDKKTDKEEKVKYFTAKVNEMDSAVKLLVKQLAENEDKVAAITDYMKQETTLRNENHAEILATIKDSEDAQAALSSAVTVLTDFYKKSGMIPKEPWEFLQTGDVELPEAPSTWDSSYTGAADPKNGAEGVLSILSATSEKFSQMEADAKAQDETDQKNYNQDMAAKKIEMEEVNMDSQMKTSRKETLQEKMEGAATTLKHTQSEVDAVEKYLKDLEPACGSGDSSYEDRKKARADEIEALKKAEQILDDSSKEK